MPTKKQNQIEIGTKFKVPTLKQFLDAGWKYYSCLKKRIYNPNYVAHYTLRCDKISKFAGKILTVEGDVIGSFNKWFMSNQYFWPVQACLDICGDPNSVQKLNGIFYQILINSATTGTNSHVHRPGETLINGWIICKDCGQDLEKFLK